MPSDSETLVTAHSAIRAFWEEEGARYDQKDAHGIFSETEHQLWTTALGVIPASSRALDIDIFAERVGIECGPDPVLLVSPNLAVWGMRP